MAVTILPGDCREVLASLPADSVHSVLTDPPYEWAFMGRKWDNTGVAFDPDTWRAVFRVMRPGAFLMAFGGTRTQHRMVCAIEDAGFDIKEQFAWVHAQGFPKSRDASKAIDQELGAVREVVGRYQPPNGQEWNLTNDTARTEIGTTGHSSRAASLDITAPATPEAAAWSGFGTAVRPSWEPIVLARKPMVGNLAQNLLRWGCGALNIDASRIPTSDADKDAINAKHAGMDAAAYQRPSGVSLQLSVKPMPLQPAQAHALGRWPSNIAHDGSPEVMAAFAAAGESKSPSVGSMGGGSNRHSIYGDFAGERHSNGHGDSGTPARFFFSPKADRADRADSRHPCVKPVDLLRHYMRLITPPGGTCLDCFAGSGTTGEAAMLEGFDCILIERDAASVADIRHRMARWSGRDLPLFVDAPEAPVMGDLFAAVAAE